MTKACLLSKAALTLLSRPPHFKIKRSQILLKGSFYATRVVYSSLPSHTGPAPRPNEAFLSFLSPLLLHSLFHGRADVRSSLWGHLLPVLRLVRFFLYSTRLQEWTSGRYKCLISIGITGRTWGRGWLRTAPQIFPTAHLKRSDRINWLTGNMEACIHWAVFILYFCNRMERRVANAARWPFIRVVMPSVWLWAEGDARCS